MLSPSWSSHSRGRLRANRRGTGREQGHLLQPPVVCRHVSRHDELLLLGDFNAATGPRTPGFEDVVGPFGYGTTNDNTVRLLSFCSSHGLVLPGAWFQRLDIHRLSWYSNDGSTKKEIYHIITCHVRAIKTYRIFRGAESPANSDHHLLVADIRIQPMFSRSGKSKRSLE